MLHLLDGLDRDCGEIVGRRVECRERGVVGENGRIAVGVVERTYHDRDILRLDVENAGEQANVRR